MRERPQRLEPLAPLGGLAIERVAQPLEADIASLARGVEVGPGGGLRVGGELGERRLARPQRAARVGEIGLRDAARLSRLLVDADMLGEARLVRQRRHRQRVDIARVGIEPRRFLGQRTRLGFAGRTLAP